MAALLLVSVPSIRPQFVTQWFTHLFNNDEPVSYNKAVRRAAPAVVNVYSSNMGSLSQQGPEMTSLGSGVIMNDQGYILTNQHVIKNADQIIVLKDGQVENTGTHEQLLSKDALYRDMWEAHIGAQNWSAGSGERR